MRRVEQHVIARSHARWDEIDRDGQRPRKTCGISPTTIRARPSFLRRPTRTRRPSIRCSKTPLRDLALPAKVANQVLIQLDTAWKSFFEANEAYKADPAKFLGRGIAAQVQAQNQGAQFTRV
jgi:putative transposase